MSLREAAERNVPPTGRPSLISKLRARLEPEQQVELDDVLGDLELTDISVARALEEVYGLKLSPTTVRTWRQTNRLR